MNIHESVRILAQIPFTVADPLVRFVLTCYPSCVAFDLIPGKFICATRASIVLKEMPFSLFVLITYCTYTFLLQVQIEAVAEATVLAHP